MGAEYGRWCKKKDGLCGGADDAESWACATSKWLLAFAGSRADSVYGAWGQLPSIAGLAGTDAKDNWFDLLLMTNSTAPYGVPLFQSILVFVVTIDHSFHG